MVLTVSRIPMQRKTLEGSLALLRGYAEEAGFSLQVYEALPTTFRPPSAYPERKRETRDYIGISTRERTVRVGIRVLWRLFAEGERGEAAWQTADFIDGFSDYVESRFHAIEDNTGITFVGSEDDPEFVLQGPRGVVTYFSSLLSLEGQTQN